MKRTTSCGLQIGTAGDVVLFHGPTTTYWSGNASRIRFDLSSADRRIDEVRAWFVAHGRDGFLWSVGASATPTDLVERLLGRGAQPNPRNPVSTPMILDHDPPPAPSGVTVRRVETFEDYRLAWEIDLEGFAAPEKDREELRARLAEDWAHFHADTHQIAYLASIEGATVAYGMLALPTVGRRISPARRPCRRPAVAERTGPSSKPDGTRPSFAGLPRSSPRPAWTRARSSSVSGSGADRRSMSSWTTRGSLSRLTPRGSRAAVSVEPLDSLPNDLNAETDPTGPPGRRYAKGLGQPPPRDAIGGGLKG
jgi:hypothetical protein